VLLLLDALGTEGIFRLSPSHLEVSTLKDAYDTGTQGGRPNLPSGEAGGWATRRRGWAAVGTAPRAC
jgi:hypothetical protein